MAGHSGLLSHAGHAFVTFHLERDRVHCLLELKHMHDPRHPVVKWLSRLLQMLRQGPSVLRAKEELHPLATPLSYTP